ncbi:Alpha/Beta hydrolase protein [Chaetomium strumarium]|uniref:Alpha/Beta hydrolase protein n=1 Tax=Chaetomium strumarium TaxID=1170767 RepID=A0AAJ0GSZ9_9PEZI|nr:Alpha/Beta hydrolase protein [Chaetomium strumarium]
MVDAGFGVVPLGIPGSPAPFSLHFSDADLNQLSSLVQTAVIGAPSFYNTHSVADSPDYAFGGTRDWLADAAEEWVKTFDWRAHETYWNSFPQFTINVTAPSDGQIFNLHFAALFSRNPDAIPILLSHGWPSSWIEFIPILELLTTKYTPETLPYHIIAPSIPDYGLSTRSNLTGTELDFHTAAEALNGLMKALGFDAYVAQGGDVGSGLTATLGAVYDECKAVHFNNFLLTSSERAGVAHLPVTREENTTFALGAQFLYAGTGYLLEQGTKPGTISLVLMTNPVAMLGWIGSMYAEASKYSVDTILQQVTWYWLTQSYGRSLWSYRSAWAAILRDDSRKLPSPLAITTKPLGYSWYPGEVLGVAKSWMEHWFPDNLCFYRAHESGGHFAAFDDPVGFLQDIEDFVAVVKTKVEF